MIENAEPVEKTGKTATCRCGAEIEELDVERGARWVHIETEDMYTLDFPGDKLPGHHPAKDAKGAVIQFLCTDGEAAWPNNRDVEDQPEIYDEMPTGEELVEMMIDEATADDDDPMVI